MTYLFFALQVEGLWPIEQQAVRPENESRMEAVSRPDFMSSLFGLCH